MKKHLFALTVTVIAIGVAFSTVSVNYQSVRDFLKTAIFAEDIFRLTNTERQQEKIGGLSIDDKLTQAAQAKANDMASKGYFAHTTPEGHRFFWWIDNVDYDYHYAGENLAVKFNTSEGAMRAWMASPGHRANILNGNFDEIGIGVADGTYEGQKVTFVVQMFGHEQQPATETENLRAAADEKPRRSRTPRFQVELVAQGNWVAAGETEKFVVVKKVATVESVLEMLYVPDILDIVSRGGRVAQLFLGDTAPPMTLQFLPL